jgi:mannopine transport system permease protein
MEENARETKEGGWSIKPPLWSGILMVLPLLAMLALFVAYPLLKLILDSFEEGGLANYIEFFQVRANVRVLFITFRVSAIVTALAISLGGTVAWTIRTSKNGVKKAILWVATLVPFWMGVVVKNYIFTMLLGRRGVLNEILRLTGLIDDPLRLLYNEPAVVIGMLYVMLPYAIFPLYVNFVTIDADMIAAAQSLGASRMRAMASVLIPLALPGIVATTSIVFIISIGFYITPIVLGGADSPFIASLIQNDMFKFYDFEGAAVSAVMLLISAVLVLAITLRAVGRERLERAIA